MATKKTKGSHTPVSINVHSRRYRLCDADGISAKALIDGFVIAGLLQDDSPEFVGAVSFTQEKIAKSENEETIVTISVHEGT